ncbi:type I-E CRISPR-associated protein Cse2/CasB [Paeniglutamicibacter sp. NPDC091659]|uniref:type I-E CRISPR-associated protein Cse2/CasB n=1 Tax=Paeniglutamicibacter sp. NPDC091659 TaxID=3364389 RepID=UPI00380FED85
MSDQFTSFIAAKITQLQRGYLNNEATAVRTMAHLRKATNRAPGTDPELWGVTLEDLPTAHQGRGQHASAAEWAAHISLSLYSVHQQGKKSKGMHESSVRFGRVVRGLSDHGMSADAVKRRFDALATASSPLEVQHHLGSLVRILRDADASIDYVRLADDLRRLLIPGQHKPVLLQWGRDFAYSKPTTTTTSSEQPATS